MDASRGIWRRTLLTALAYLGALLLTAVGMAFAVLALAGPHGGVLPRVLQVPFYLLAWMLVLLLPVFAARRVWRRLG